MDRLVVILLGLFVLSSCIPPKKEEFRFEYNYSQGKVYTYSLTVDGDGIFTYFLLSFSGKVKLTTDVILSVSETERAKLYTMRFEKVDVKSSLGFEQEINKLLSQTNFIVSFYMTSKGRKEVLNSEYLSILLDILIPRLPELDTTNEMSYREFDLSFGDTTVRNEVSNVSAITPVSAKTFSLNNFSSILSLELQNRDIVVGDIKVKGESRVDDFILTENITEIDSKTTIPIYTGSATRVVGFKGKVRLVLKLKEAS